MLGKCRADEGRFRIGVGVGKDDFAHPRRGHIRGLIVLAHLAQVAVSHGLPKRLQVLAVNDRAPCGEVKNQFALPIKINRGKKGVRRESLDAVLPAIGDAEGWLGAFLVTCVMLLGGSGFFVGGFDYGL